MTADDRAAVRAYYDGLGAAEADRLTADPAGRASFEVHRRFLADAGRWARFLDHEVAACAEPGALDGGTHVLVAVAHA